MYLSISTAFARVVCMCKINHSCEFLLHWSSNCARWSPVWDSTKIFSRLVWAPGTMPGAFELLERLSFLSVQLLLSSLFSHFLCITHTVRWGTVLIQLCCSSSGSYNTHPLMILEDASGSMEFTVTGLQGKSHTFLGVSLDNVRNMSLWVCLESLDNATINWPPS